MLRTRENEPRKSASDITRFWQERGAGWHGSHHLYTRLLGLEVTETAQLVHLVEEGLSIHALERFQFNIELPMEDVADLVQIKRRTLSRRKEEGRLQPDESDRLVRASRVFGKALELFEGDADAARRWLSSAQPALGGASPLAMARTEVGARAVEELIGRLEQGVFS